MKAQMVKWRNRLAVRIPKPVAEAAEFNEGDWLEFRILVDHIELHKITRIPSLAKLLAQITPENRYGEISSGSESRKEEIEW